jgi:hypothetical protein
MRVRESRSILFYVLDRSSEIDFWMASRVTIFSRIPQKYLPKSEEGEGQERQLPKEGRGQERQAPGSSLPRDQQERERPNSVQPLEKDRRKTERRQAKGSMKRKHKSTTVSKNFGPPHAAFSTSFVTGAFRLLITGPTKM